MTKKRISSSRGGNINNQVGLDKILSIGYEVESTNLIKLTETQEFENTLYNSDSARKDMEEFKKLKYDDFDSEDVSTPTSASSSESRTRSSSNNSIASSINLKKTKNPEQNIQMLYLTLQMTYQNQNLTEH